MVWRSKFSELRYLSSEHQQNRLKMSKFEVWANSLLLRFEEQVSYPCYQLIKMWKLFHWWICENRDISSNNMFCAIKTARIRSISPILLSCYSFRHSNPPNSPETRIFHQFKDGRLNFPRIDIFSMFMKKKKSQKINSWLPHQNTNKRHAHCRLWIYEWNFAFLYVAIDKCEEYWLVE